MLVDGGNHLRMLKNADLRRRTNRARIATWLHQKRSVVRRVLVQCQRLALRLFLRLAAADAGEGSFREAGAAVVVLAVLAERDDRGRITDAV